MNTTDPMAGNETLTAGQYPRLSGQQLAAVAAYGQRRPTRQGEVLYDQGEENYDFVVVLDGRVAVVGGHGGELLVGGIHGGPLFGRAGPAQRPGAVLAAVVLGRCWWSRRSASASCSRAIPASGTWCCGPISCAAPSRSRSGRAWGSWAPSLTDTRRLRGFAVRNRLRQRWIDADDRRAEAPLRELGVAPQQTLVVLWRGELGPANPSNAELARMIALLMPSSGETVCDLVLVGVGTGELAAAVHKAIDGLAAVALAAISPSCCRVPCSGSRAIPGSRPGSQKRSWPSVRPSRAGTLAAQEVQLAGGP